jgi:hypothetical protein|tara:strand:+ start:2108 stop:2353 length:246 start_codon:yes stop_codon:yes gene_type:complete
MRLVVVEWLDIYATCGWEKADEAEPQRLWSTGYLVHKDKKVVKIATTKDEKGEWYSFHAFPAGCIVSITNITSNPEATSSE